MKRLIELLGIVICVILLHSCTTSQKITIQGTPGTEIYSPAMERLGTVSSNGKVSFKISSDDYFSYLMSKNAGANEQIPFALDYKRHSFIGTQILKWTGYTVVAAGAFSVLVGGIACIGGDGDEVGGPFLAAGGGAAALGAIIGMPADMRSNQTQYEHKYKYLSVQETNQDVHFTQIVDVGYRKTKHNYDNNAPHVSDRANNGSPSSTATRRKSSVSKRTLNDNAKLVSGSYFGTGYLTQKGKVIEEYAKIKVVIARIDNNNVNIDVFENGESYFSKTNKYQVTKKGKNTYVLSLDGISDALITIDNTGHLTYIHPKVNIDGEIYTLNLTANKK